MAHEIGLSRNYTPPPKPGIQNQQNMAQKKQIMEYLKVVKSKVASMESKLAAETKEADYYRRRVKELEKLNEEILEKERMMALKYGVLITQKLRNDEKLEKKKVQLTDL